MDLSNEQQAQVKRLLVLIAMKEEEVVALRERLSKVLGVDISQGQYILNVDKGTLDAAQHP